MTAKLIVGIVGIAGSGKTLVARHMVERHGFQRSRFAAPLKAMLMVGLGLTEDQVDGDAKTESIPTAGGHTARHLMQTLGTAWGRQMIHSDLWVHRWRALTAASNAREIVVDDVRFPNEAAAIREAGGSIWRVVRPGLATMNHVSERGGRNIEEDVLIANATTIPDMLRSVDAAVARAR